MKKVYMINYDLNRPGQEYNELINTIKGYGSYAKCLKSGWFVQTSDSSIDIYNKLSKYLDKNDRIFICLVTGDYWGYLGSNVIDWLSGRV